MVVSGLDPPVPEFRLLLELTDLSSDSASAAEDFFPEPGSRSAWPGFVDTFRLKLRGSPLAPGGGGGAPSGPLQSQGVSCDPGKSCVQDTGNFCRDLRTCCFG